MIVTRTSIARRTIIRGMGVSLALPLLDAMVPALTAIQKTPARPTPRFGVVYVPNGIMMENWTPAADGAGFTLSPSLTPLEPFREQLVVLTGLDNRGSGHVPGSTSFLTDMSPNAGADVKAGVSVDQMVARELGRQTQLGSLELSLDSPESSGTCGAGGYSCTYTNTLCWRSPTTPLPMEHNPRAAFERLFGDNESTDRSTRLASAQRNRSILDSVTRKLAGFRQGLGPDDRAKLGEYVDSVRDVERRIQKVEEQSAQELPTLEQPGGIPADFSAYAKLMFDLQVLGYQSDLTRVVTFMMGRELNSRTYPELGIAEAHHPLSHHAGDPDKLSKLAKINTLHTSLFAYYLEKLRSTPDGDGSLLDQVIILYGSGLSDGNQHSPRSLPIILLGGGAGTLRGGRHVRFSGGVPLANLHLTLLRTFGVRDAGIGNSTGELEELSAL